MDQVHREAVAGQAAVAREDGPREVEVDMEVYICRFYLNVFKRRKRERRNNMNQCEKDSLFPSRAFSVFDLRSKMCTPKHVKRDQSYLELLHLDSLI